MAAETKDAVCGALADIIPISQIRDVVKALRTVRVETNVSRKLELLFGKSAGLTGTIMECAHELDVCMDIREAVNTYLSLKGWHYVATDRYQRDEKAAYYYIRVDDASNIGQLIPIEVDKPLDLAKLSVVECQKMFKKLTPVTVLADHRKRHAFKWYTSDDFKYLDDGWFRFPVKKIE